MFWKQRKRIADAEAELGRLRKDLAELRDAMLELKQSEIEREDLYEKMRTLYARLNKRTQRDEGVEVSQREAPLNPAAIRLLNPYGNGR